mmetsp:Transcript_4013/g.8614  ORF Transcript_4013/g.8614 Transcript_4013/m.8614 type:complete len:213 (-) Transcript_4013:606-1244(-)
MVVRVGQRAALVERREILALDRLLHGDALGRVELEHAIEQREGLGRRVGVEFGPLAPRLLRQRAEERDRLLVVDALEVFLRRSSDHVDDEAQLVQVVAALKECLPPEHLGENAADGPRVDRHRVRLVLHQQLGRAIPARHHVLGESHVLGIGAWGHRPRQPEVADLEVAVLVHEQVARLEIAVEHVRRVHSVDAAQNLVEKVLEVLVRQRLL